MNSVGTTNSEMWIIPLHTIKHHFKFTFWVISRWPIIHHTSWWYWSWCFTVTSMLKIHQLIGWSIIFILIGITSLALRITATIRSVLSMLSLLLLMIASTVLVKVDTDTCKMMPSLWILISLTNSSFSSFRAKSIFDYHLDNRGITQSLF